MSGWLRAPQPDAPTGSAVPHDMHQYQAIVGLFMSSALDEADEPPMVLLKTASAPTPTSCGRWSSSWRSG